MIKCPSCQENVTELYNEFACHECCAFFAGCDSVEGFLSTLTNKCIECDSHDGHPVFGYKGSIDYYVCDPCFANYIKQAKGTVK